MENKYIEKVNLLVFNYLSLIGISKDEKISEDNPISNYFYKNIYKFGVVKNTNVISDDIVLSKEDFYKIISESYRIYNKIDILLNNQNDIYKQIISQMIDDDVDYYINTIAEQYKDSLYDILLDYKLDDLNKIKIHVFTDKMFYYASLEEYEKSAEIKNIIEKIKGKI